MAPRRRAAAPFLVDGDRHPGRPAPALGVEAPRPRARARPAATGGSLAGGPLTGIRIVDLSMFWSGPLATDLFAQYGADVVKVESVQRVDGWRGLSGNPGIEGSNLFNGVNLNKSAVTLDLTSARGKELLRPLVAAADALVEN
ncbi:MAG TPA: CoA transferase, partial [Ilumatobacteraceae bacterium]|nr:CoA transferase [Ilumatobacteraceae bacterium]